MKKLNNSKNILKIYANRFCLEKFYKVEMNKDNDSYLKRIFLKYFS